MSLTGKDLVEAISVDYPLRFVSEILRENLIVMGVLKNYKWKKKVAQQEQQVFDSLKNSLIDNEASVVFVQTPSPKLLAMNKETLESLTSDAGFQMRIKTE